MIILHKKGDVKDMKKVLDENQPRVQVDFRRGYMAFDRLHSVNQLTEKCNEFSIPLYIRDIDNEKAFDSIEYEAICKAIGSIGINENCITSLKDIYTGATA